MGITGVVAGVAHLMADAYSGIGSAEMDDDDDEGEVGERETGKNRKEEAEEQQYEAIDQTLVKLEEELRVHLKNHLDGFPDFVLRVPNAFEALLALGYNPVFFTGQLLDRINENPLDLVQLERIVSLLKIFPFKNTMLIEALTQSTVTLFFDNYANLEAPKNWSLDTIYTWLEILRLLIAEFEGIDTFNNCIFHLSVIDESLDNRLEEDEEVSDLGNIDWVYLNMMEQPLDEVVSEEALEAFLSRMSSSDIETAQRLHASIEETKRFLENFTKDGVFTGRVFLYCILGLGKEYTRSVAEHIETYEEFIGSCQNSGRNCQRGEGMFQGKDRVTVRRA